VVDMAGGDDDHAVLAPDQNTFLGWRRRKPRAACRFNP
jgi:hypothetical protein